MTKRAVPLRFTIASLLLSACTLAPAPEEEVRPPARRPDPPRFECALGGPARTFEGERPALASDAVVVHDADGRGTLHRLDSPSEPTRSVAARVLAMARRGEGWIVVRPDGVSTLDPDGALGEPAALEVEAVEAALALERGRAWVVTRDAEDEISLRAVDLTSMRAEAAISVGRGRGRLLVAPGRASWAGPQARIVTAEGELEIEGAPAALVDEHVVHASSTGTGLWVGDAPAARVTQAWSSPEAPVAAALGTHIVLAYRSDGDLLVQLADPTLGALGQPMLVAPDAIASHVVARGERFWVAWARGDETVAVRAGECRGR